MPELPQVVILAYGDYYHIGERYPVIVREYNPVARLEINLRVWHDV